MVQDLTEAFHEGVDARLLTHAERVLRKVSGGNSWLIGGSLYRTIAARLYGGAMPEVDFDFLVEELDPDPAIPGWTVVRNRYGNPKLERDGLSIDIVPLRTVRSILRRGLEPTIGNFLTGTPLTVQSIVYDLSTREVQGTIGVRALHERTVGINDRDWAQYVASRNGTTVDRMVEEKARSLGFTPIYP